MSVKQFTWMIGFLLVFYGCQSQPKPTKEIWSTKMPQINPRTLEKRLHQMINQERENRDLRSFTSKDKLQQVARKHSKDMAQTGFFSHVNPKGLDAMTRGEEGGVPCKRRLSTGVFRVGIAENLFQTHVYSAIRFISTDDTKQKQYQWRSVDQIAKSIIRGWLSSPTHRKNMLHTQYTDAGIGVSITQGGKVYVTHNFC